MLNQQSWWRRLAHRQARRLMGPWFVRLLVVTVTAQFLSSSVRPLLTYKSLAAGANPLEVGLIAAAFSVLALFAAIPLGRAIDRHGEIGFLTVGAILAGVTLLGLMVPADLWVLGICSAVLGLGHLAMVAAGQTLIARGSQPTRREARFATLTSVNAVAQTIGPAVTGLLIVEVSTPGSDTAVPGDLAVLGIAVGLAGLAALAAISLRTWPGSLVRRAPASAPIERGAVRAVLGQPSVPTAMFASMSVLTCMDLLLTYLPVLGHQYGLSPGTVGLLLATQGAAGMVIRLWMVQLVARFTRRYVLIGTMTLAATAMAALPLASRLDNPEPVLFAVMALAGFGLGIGLPATMAWIALETPTSLRGTSVTLRLAGNRIALILVPIAGGALANYLGVAAIFWWAASVLAVGMALVAIAPATHRAEGA